MLSKKYFEDCHIYDKWKIIERMATMAMAAMMVIVLATVKGGVGKTTLAAHIAAALADLGIDTLLADLDPQGHATLRAGIDADPQAPCIGDALLDPAAMASVVVRSAQRPALRIAPAVLRMALIERQIYPQAMRIRFLERALHAMKKPPAVVIVDTPPHLGAFTESALYVANTTLAPVPAMAGSLQGVADLRDTWTEMQDGKKGKLAVVANMTDGRVKNTNIVFWPALKELGIPILNTRIPRAEAINQAGLSHSLIFDSSPEHPACGSLREMAAEVWALTKGKR